MYYNAIRIMNDMMNKALKLCDIKFIECDRKYTRIINKIFSCSTKHIFLSGAIK